MRLPSASKNKYLTILFAALAIVGLFYGLHLLRDPLAKLAWRFHLGLIALAVDSRNAPLAFDIGNYYFNGGAYNLIRSQRAFEKALRLDPKTPLAHYQLGRIYFIKGDLDAATGEIQKELALHPEIPSSYYVLGLIHGYRGNFVEAEHDFRVFIAKVPQQWAGYNDLAWILAKEGQFAEVKKTIQDAFRRMPGIEKRNPWLWTSLGIAHLNLKEYNEAKDAFNNAVNLTDSMSALLFWSAYPGNDPRGAESAFKQFRATLHFNLGLVYENLRDFAKSADEYRAYLALIPEEYAVSRPAVEEKLKKLESK